MKVEILQKGQFNGQRERLATVDPENQWLLGARLRARHTTLALQSSGQNSISMSSDTIKYGLAVERSCPKV